MPDMPPRPDVVQLEGPYTHEYIHTRGVRLHAAMAGKPGAPLVVLLHDAFGAWFDFEHVIAPLSASGYRVAAVDLRGYGMSDKPPPGPSFSAATLASDIAGLIPTLGYNKAVVVGCDTGGSVAWTLATTHPDRVSALVSIASAHPADLRRSVARRPWEFLWLILRQCALRVPIQTAVSREVANFLARNTSGEFHRSAAYRRALDNRRQASSISSVAPAIARTNRILLTPPPLRQINSLVTAPTLMLNAPQSLWRRVNERSSLRLAEGVRWESGSVPGAKNLPHVEAPAAFVDKLRTFLAG